MLQTAFLDVDVSVLVMMRWPDPSSVSTYIFVYHFLYYALRYLYCVQRLSVHSKGLMMDMILHLDQMQLLLRLISLNHVPVF